MKKFYKYDTPLVMLEILTVTNGFHKKKNTKKKKMWQGYRKDGLLNEFYGNYKKDASTQD